MKKLVEVSNRHVSSWKNMAEGLGDSNVLPWEMLPSYGDILQSVNKASKERQRDNREYAQGKHYNTLDIA